MNAFSHPQFAPTQSFQLDDARPVTCGIGSWLIDFRSGGSATLNGETRTTDRYNLSHERSGARTANSVPTANDAHRGGGRFHLACVVDACARLDRQARSLRLSVDPRHVRRRADRSQRRGPCPGGLWLLGEKGADAVYCHPKDLATARSLFPEANVQPLT